MNTTYITIDGDDIGQKISACYFRNDSEALLDLNRSIENIVAHIATLLEDQGYVVIFSAADGVTAFSTSPILSNAELYGEISKIGGKQLTFSAGVGATLREAYIALLTSKSNGKAQLTAYSELDKICSEY
ncbi:mCpol domain-containing protein [Martelella limonii]|uniref:mCpol domain-containing protein n=1 Tax=Martelella limonii TaxID=1647649 RepID=UPI00158012C5